MERAEITRRLSELSGALVLADPGHAAALEDLGRAFAAIAAAGWGDAEPYARRIGERGAEEVERALSGVAGTDRLLERLGSAVAALQEIASGQAPEAALRAFLASCGPEEGHPASRDPTSPSAAPAGVGTEAGTAAGAAGDTAAGSADDTVSDTAGDTADAGRVREDLELSVEFIAEAREHLEAIERNVLAVERDGGDTEARDALFRCFHTIKGFAGYLELTEITALAHEAESLLAAIGAGRLDWSPRVVEAVLRSGDGMKRLFDLFSDAVTAGARPLPYPGLPALLSTLRAASEGTPGEPARSEPARGTEETPERPAAPRRRPPAGQAPGKRLRDYVRVEASQLDALIDAVGELVVTVSVMNQSMALAPNSPGGAALKAVVSLSKHIQARSTALRMVPLRSTFLRMERVVRDLAVQSGKHVDLVTSGDDTEIDKAMVDKLADPLLHLMRNAVDHGLEESAEDRVLRGKGSRASIRLSAGHEGSSILIRVSDDGRGLDHDRIIERARERGLVAPGEVLDERAVHSLILEPGFSTAREVTAVSGRGVGMDVVRRNVEELRGSLEISSRAGQGTTFTMRLPLTVATIDGVLVRVGKERYVIPVHCVARTVRPLARDISTIPGGGEILNVEGAVIPLVRLGRALGVAGAETDPARSLVVIIDVDGRLSGLLTDELIAEQQVVVKSLGSPLVKTPEVAGGAILADGQVGLILDVNHIVRAGGCGVFPILSRC
jgi:two-component system chemotaxis sensor kinase CheA